MNGESHENIEVPERVQLEPKDIDSIGSIHEQIKELNGAIDEEMGVFRILTFQEKMKGALKGVSQVIVQQREKERQSYETISELNHKIEKLNAALEEQKELSEKNNGLISTIREDLSSTQKCLLEKEENNNVLKMEQEKLGVTLTQSQNNLEKQEIQIKALEKENSELSLYKERTIILEEANKRLQSEVSSITREASQALEKLDIEEQAQEEKEKLFQHSETTILEDKQRLDDFIKLMEETPENPLSKIISNNHTIEELKNIEAKDVSSTVISILVEVHNKLFNQNSELERVEEDFQNDDSEEKKADENMDKQESDIDSKGNEEKEANNNINKVSDEIYSKGNEVDNDQEVKQSQENEKQKEPDEIDSKESKQDPESKESLENDIKQEPNFVDSNENKESPEFFLESYSINQDESVSQKLPKSSNDQSNEFDPPSENAPEDPPEKTDLPDPSFSDPQPETIDDPKINPESKEIIPQDSEEKKEDSVKKSGRANDQELFEANSQPKQDDSFRSLKSTQMVPASFAPVLESKRQQLHKSFQAGSRKLNPESLHSKPSESSPSSVVVQVYNPYTKKKPEFFDERQNYGAHSEIVKDYTHPNPRDRPKYVTVSADAFKKGEPIAASKLMDKPSWKNAKEFFESTDSSTNRIPSPDKITSPH